MDHQDHHEGYEGQLQTAQVFPLASLMKPCSPHPLPQEFLIFQKASVAPTRRTPWLTEVPQLERTPPLYWDQTEASTATEMGLPLRALRRLSQPGTSTNPLILTSPPSLAQAWFLATQGQLSSLVIPWSMTYWKAESIQPPLHPWFPQDLEQSTSCCSERLMVWPAIRSPLSMAAVAEKAQHEPHWPWFLTLETLPLEDQSMSPLDGAAAVRPWTTSVNLSLTLAVRYMLMNSASVKSENWVTPRV